LSLIGRNPVNEHFEIAARVIAAVGKAGAAELLDVLTRPEADRAALLGRLSLRADAEWLAELLIYLEEDELARLHLIEALRRTTEVTGLRIPGA
jgi:hypothetical protein